MYVVELYQRSIGERNCIRVDCTPLVVQLQFIYFKLHFVRVDAF